MKTYLCLICGVVYDEAKGWPEEGIEPGTLWQDVPDSWTCPDCGATKQDFDMVAVGASHSEECATTNDSGSSL